MSEYMAERHIKRCTQIVQDLMASRQLDHATQNWSLRRGHESPAWKVASLYAKLIGDLHQIIEDDAFYDSKVVEMIGMKLRPTVFRMLTIAQDDFDIDYEPRPGENAVRLDEDKVRQIRTRWAEGATAADLAQEFNISSPHAYSVATRKAWRHVE